MIKNIFTVAPTLVKLLGSMAHNVKALAMWLEFIASSARLQMPGKG
jgi:hypothetical protein